MKKGKVRASCHCGSIQLDVSLPSNGLDKMMRCNCSICSRGKGFAMISVPLQNVEIIEGKKSIAEYIFNTATAPHFFCIVCGIHIYHKSRTNPDSYCINVACINGVNVRDYIDVVINFDGINHPNDVS